jgi:hypothetical protein
MARGCRDPNTLYCWSKTARLYHRVREIHLTVNNDRVVVANCHQTCSLDRAVRKGSAPWRVVTRVTDIPGRGGNNGRRPCKRCTPKT